MSGLSDWKSEGVQAEKPESGTANNGKAKYDYDITMNVIPGDGETLVVSLGKRPPGSVADSTKSRNVRFTDEQWERLTNAVEGNLNLAVPSLVEYALNILEEKKQTLKVAVKRK